MRRCSWQSEKSDDENHSFRFVVGCHKRAVQITPPENSGSAWRRRFAIRAYPWQKQLKFIRHIQLPAPPLLCATNPSQQFRHAGRQVMPLREVVFHPRQLQRYFTLNTASPPITGAPLQGCFLDPTLGGKYFIPIRFACPQHDLPFPGRSLPPPCNLIDNFPAQFMVEASPSLLRQIRPPS